MTLKVQEFLRNGGTIEQLAEKYAIKATKKDSLVLLKYNQIESDFNEEIVRECRGIILDSEDNWRVIYWFSPKFFNYGEQLAANIDWNSARISEKIDGSTGGLWNYKGIWYMSTSGSFGGGELPQLKEKTFEQLFWETFNGKNLHLPLDTNKCYTFELVSIWNRIVVRYTESDLYLLSVRDLETLQEVSIVKYAKEIGTRTPNIHLLNSIEDVVNFANTFSGIDLEGFVVSDANFNRIKVKNVKYLALAHLVDANGRFSNRRILALVRAGEQEEILSYWNEYRPQFNKISQQYQALIDLLQASWDMNKDKIKVSRKEFALSVCKISFSGVLFGLLDGKFTSIKEGVDNIPLETLADALKD